MDRQEARRIGNQRQRREISGHIVRHTRLQQRQHPYRTAVKQQRVTSGRRFRHQVRGYCRAAASIVDDHLLSQSAGHALRNEAHHEIGATARFGRDYAYGFSGKILTLCCA